ncbi:MAG: response regulator transcription factor [Catenulisporales bacterium]|nr:response regulator transcription factor [Catenulisporales bacterium]
MRTIRRVQQKRQRAPEVSAAEKHQRVVTADGKTHVSRIMAKLGTRDRSRIVVLAYEYGMVSPGWLSD